MNLEELQALAMQLLVGSTNALDPPMQVMNYDPPIAEAKMEIVGGGIMQYKTGGSTWRDADELSGASGHLGISTIQMDGDGNELPTSNRITALQWKPESLGVPQNLVVRRV